MIINNQKAKKIKLSENEIKLLICTLQASIDGARNIYTLPLESDRINALETQRQKAHLIQKLKQYTTCIEDM